MGKSNLGSIVEQLKGDLRTAGAARFEEIAAETNVAASFIRKFVYGSRENPRVQTIQPLIDYFAAQKKNTDHASS